jgi:Na+/proline symporter
VPSNKYLNGLLYAIFVWLIMTFIVLPLSALHNKPSGFSWQTVMGWFILAIVFGLPISLLTEKYYKDRTVADIGNRRGAER